MIRETEVSIVSFYFWHVARRAVLLCDRAHARLLVTRQTLRIIVSRISSQRLMRIMTAGTTDATIVRVTLTLKNSIRLKANTNRLRHCRQRRLIVTEVARATEILRHPITAK